MKQSSVPVQTAAPAEPVIRMPKGLLLLDGKLSGVSPSARRIDVLNPATGERITTIPACSAADVDHAVMAAQRCFESTAWQSMRPLDRGRLLERLALLLEENAEQFAQLESLDSGKLLSVTRMIDIPFAIEALRYFAGWSSKIAGEYIALSPLVQDGAMYRAYTER
ncbi:MAG: aldehyde dehydrogenase family protein, partial [Alcaligenes pakistanensis]